MICEARAGLSRMAVSRAKCGFCMVVSISALHETSASESHWQLLNCQLCLRECGLS